MEPAKDVPGSSFFPGLIATLAAAVIGALPAVASEIPPGMSATALLLQESPESARPTGDENASAASATQDWLTLAQRNPKRWSYEAAPVQKELDLTEAPVIGMEAFRKLGLADLIPGADRRRSLSYALATGTAARLLPYRALQGGFPAVAPSNAQDARFESNPFLYDFDFVDLTREVAPILWSLEQSARNACGTARDLRGILIPGLWGLRPRIEIGPGFRLPATFPRNRPTELEEALQGDAFFQPEQVLVLAPIEIDAVPEPSTAALFGICAGAGLLLLTMFRKVSAGRA
jgi:hypothetical protein